MIVLRGDACFGSWERAFGFLLMHRHMAHGTKMLCAGLTTLQERANSHEPRLLDKREKQEGKAYLDHVKAPDVALLVDGDVVGVLDEVGGVDLLGAEAKVRNGQAARLRSHSEQCVRVRDVKHQAN